MCVLHEKNTQNTKESFGCLEPTATGKDFASPILTVGKVKFSVWVPRLLSLAREER